MARKIILWCAIPIIITAAIWIAWGHLFFWNALGRLFANFADLASLVLVLAGLLYAMMPTKAVKAEERKWHRPIGALFVLIGIAGFGFGLRDKAESRRQVETLLNASRGQATASDMRLLREDIGSLRRESQAGFDSVVEAIKGLGKIHGTVGATKKPSQELPVHPEPTVVEHIQVAQIPANSALPPNAKYGLQVTISTDVMSQPTALMVECDGDIEDGDFFVAGQLLMMGMGYGVQQDKRRFALKFSFPPFTPQSPIVLTLFSKTEIRVIAVRRIKLR
jgi:hypothetical protein